MPEHRVVRDSIKHCSFACFFYNCVPLHLLLRWHANFHPKTTLYICIQSRAGKINFQSALLTGTLHFGFKRNFTSHRCWRVAGDTGGSILIPALFKKKKLTISMLVAIYGHSICQCVAHVYPLLVHFLVQGGVIRSNGSISCVDDGRAIS